MKKIFLITFCSTLFTIVSYSQQEQLFRLNNEGECEISDSLHTSMDASMAYFAVKDWAYKVSTGMAPVFSKDTKNESFQALLSVNTRRVSNPFGGVFVETLYMKCEVTFRDNLVVYRLHSFEISQIYAGWGSRNTTTPLDFKLNKYETAKADLAEANNKNSGMSGAERQAVIKESNDIIKETEAMLKSSTKVMKKHLDELSKVLK